jgi:type VI secretion system secreted protein Hcp
MAIDAYVIFKPYKLPALDSESQVDMSKNNEELAEPFKKCTAAASSGGKANTGKIFEIEDYSFDIEQVLNIGSQSSGAGAGKVTFNPFSITRAIDTASSVLFDMACAGTAFETVYLGLRKSVGAGATGATSMVSGFIFLRFDFKLVAVKTISWAHDDERPKETVTFEYGGLQIRYTQQNPDGTLNAVKIGGWNRVRNVQDHATDTL